MFTIEKTGLAQLISKSLEEVASSILKAKAVTREFTVKFEALSNEDKVFAAAVCADFNQNIRILSEAGVAPGFSEFLSLAPDLARTGEFSDSVLDLLNKYYDENEHIGRYIEETDKAGREKVRNGFLKAE